MLSSSLTQLKRTATPFKSAVTPMAQPDTAVQLSRLWVLWRFTPFSKGPVEAPGLLQPSCFSLAECVILLL